jgi:hypothetical protein
MVAEGEMRNYPLPQIPLVLAVCRWVEEEAPHEEEVREVREVGEVQKVREVREVDMKVAEDPKDLKKGDEEKEPALVVKKGSTSINKGGSINEVEKSWTEFLNRVRGANAHVFALLRATRPSSYDGDSINLEVFYRIHKDKLEEPKIIKMLDTTMGEKLGRDVRLKFVLAKRESTPTSIVIKSDVVDAQARELEQIAQEIFSK